MSSSLQQDVHSSNLKADPTKLTATNAAVRTKDFGKLPSVASKASPLLRTPPEQPVALILEFWMRSPAHRPWFETWHDVLRQARQTPGCRRIALEQDPHRNACWRVVSEWESREMLAFFWRAHGISWLNHAFDHVVRLKRVSTRAVRNYAAA